ncbi:DUF2238 domain-containing protein [Pseudomonas aeruginosa]|uniref:DUF2238 domain-containing protein n=1 Tax=Pseudomonas aeruginosa TaxID=287 RepID=UPI001573AC2B|nr:DUF2238 domain-containing protein [Pseudomonas aeruginosa]MCV4187559.1 DUF2238 domain-containing protein [Pseudomonas aeruginosa]NTS93228.1 DUF2238 domain-containing protein [Pseudomonas aeruginosa]
MRRAQPAPHRAFGLGEARERSLLLGGFLLAFVLLGLAPHDRGDWLLENLLVAALGLGLFAVRRWFRPSPAASRRLFLFLLVHEIGAHYTYSRVPYDQAWTWLSGFSLDAALGWRRNQFDRLAHGLYGFLLVLPWRELLERLGLRRSLAGFLAIDLVLSTSALYELIEWLGGEYLGGARSAAFVGAQDDAWDAQKDMALALGGALLASILALRRRS